MVNPIPISIDPSEVPESFADLSLYRAALCFNSPHVLIRFPPRTLRYLRVLGRKIPRQGYLLRDCAEYVIERIAYSVLTAQQVAAVERIEDLQSRKEQAIEAQDFELAARLRDKQLPLRELLIPQNPIGAYEIGVADVAAVLLRFGIDVEA